jgi:hypothetical protein
VTGRSRRWAARVCAVGLAGVTVAGCGSSAASQSQLRAQATAICTRINHRVSGIGTPPSEAGGEAFLQHGIAALKPELKQLQQLTPSGDAADVWTAALHSLSSELAAMQAASAQIDGGADAATAYKKLQQTLAPLETQANNAWSALEIPACQNQ